MKPFKFFQKQTSTLDMIEGETYATASFADTPEGHMRRRMLYHTNQTEYNRLRGNNNNEMEQYYIDRFIRNTITEEQASNISRRINGGAQHTDNHGNTDFVPFSFGTTRVTRVNPKWWMKVKMFYQKFKYNSVIETNSDLIGIFVVATSITLSVGFVIAKILNIW